MSDLRIAVRREYFEEIKALIKKEEYRVNNAYWQKRLHGRHYDTVTITLGYPKKGDKEREITFPYRGYTMKVIKHREFNNELIEVFAIKLEVNQ